jgi:hypothetical protein
MLPLAIAFLAVLLLWPVVGVSRPMPADFLTHPQLTVYALCFFTACIAYWEVVATLFDLNKQNLIPRLQVLSWCVYLSLFLTSCLLCRRLKVCIIHIHNISAPFGAWIGPPLVLAGAIMVIRSRSEKKGEKPGLIAYPQFTGLLLILTGVSLAHWAWLPLLALPGILVIESWYIRRKEASEAQKIDSAAAKARFRVLPFIY